MKRFVVFLIFVVILSGLPGSTIRAAVEIAESMPVSGASMTELPSKVEVWSSETLDPAYIQVIVVSPNGARIDSGQVESDPADQTHFATTLSSGGPAGHYTVHLLSGEPNTARERSASFAFDLTNDSGCDVANPGVGCAETLPEISEGEQLSLPSGHTVMVNLSSDNAGPVDIVVDLRDPDGNPVESAQVWVRAAHLEMDHGEFPHAAVLNDDGVFVASYIGMGMEGSWRVAIDLILADGESPLTIAVPVEMRQPG